MSFEAILGLVALFQVKHFLADYPLQGSYMLGKFKSGKEWVLPLAAHCAVHAIFTFIIALCIQPAMAGTAAAFDFIAHFLMDRCKASPQLLGRYKALSAAEYPSATEVQKQANTYFWWALGLDQLVHHLCDLVIIWLLMRAL